MRSRALQDMELSEQLSPALQGEAATTVLVLPGWQGIGPDHWQMHWLRQHAYTLVEQADWMRPRRGDWLARLDEVVIDAPGQVVLVAHSLACILVAAWAVFSRHTARARGALLVAPTDVESHDMKIRLSGWSPILRQTLPFRSMVVASDNDPYCSLQRAHGLAQDWGSEWQWMSAAVHINAESSLHDWPQGHALLRTLLKD